MRFVSIAMLAAVAGVAEAQVDRGPPPEHAPLIAATNAVVGLARNPDPPTAAQRPAVAAACEALRALVSDRRLRDSVLYWSSERPFAEERARLAGQFTYFDEFLRAEAALLRSWGFSDQVVETAIWAATVHREAARSDNIPDVLTELDRLTGDFCDAARLLDPPGDATFWSTLKRYGVRLTAAAILAVDALGGPVTGGLSVASVLLSGAIMLPDWLGQ